MSETTTRLLRLLALLQQRPVWTGPELAERLGVTTRSIRRDVERLRVLGYPVHAQQGAGGGYQLGRGKELPPLLLDDEEAVATAISLRLAAGGTVTGASEAALRTLAKLDAVMPPRLRSEVHAISEATDILLGGSIEVDGEALLRLARACRDQVRVRFDYTTRDDRAAERHVEPVRLVATGRRWYLMAFDLDRDDWRTFRLDRMGEVRVGTWRFQLRDHPDPLEYVQRSLSQSAYPTTAQVRVQAPATVLRDQVSPAAGEVVEVDEASCRLLLGYDDPEWLVWYLLRLGHPLRIEQPPELAGAVRDICARVQALAMPD